MTSVNLCISKVKCAIRGVINPRVYQQLLLIIWVTKRTNINPNPQDTENTAASTSILVANQVTLPQLHFNPSTFLKAVLIFKDNRVYIQIKVKIMSSDKLCITKTNKMMVFKYLKSC